MNIPEHLQITKVTITQHGNIENDRRYRVLVMLQRSDRPKYWTFYCPMCTMPVAELNNHDVIGMSDLVDLDAAEVGLVGVRCDGRYQGGKCRVWYYFKLN